MHHFGPIVTIAPLVAAPLRRNPKEGESPVAALPPSRCAALRCAATVRPQLAIMVGSLLFGVAVDHTKKYYSATLFCFCASFFWLAAASNESVHGDVLIAAMLALGFFVGPIQARRTLGSSTRDMPLAVSHGRDAVAAGGSNDEPTTTRV